MKARGIVHKYGDNVDTDVIIPARYLNSSDAKDLASHCMEDIDKDFVKKVKTGDIMVANKNFGCGSSREHAPLAIKTAGISCVIAETFARIFYRNAINIGLPILECSEAAKAIEAGILLYLAPSFVVLMSALFWKAPITKRKVMALVVSFLGCVLVSGIMSGALTVSVTGLLLGIGAGFCYATYTIFAHYGLEHYDSLTMIYWTFFFAGLGSLAFLNWGELAPALPLGTTWIGMAGLVVIATVLPYLFYTKGLEVVESGKASIIANVEPVVAALTGVVFFHEVLNVWTVLGIVSVLGGVVLLAKE